MTDAGSFLPREDATDSARRARLLRRIAAALALPVSAFTPGRDAQEANASPSPAECEAALAAFSKIEDPQLRTYCLRILESFAER